MTAVLSSNLYEAGGRAVIGAVLEYFHLPEVFEDLGQQFGRVDLYKDVYDLVQGLIFHQVVPIDVRKYVF